MSTSYEPPPGSGSASMETAPDPVVAIIERAGLTVGPGVAECVALAAGAHAQRYDSEHADRPLVNRSTFLWALARTDDVVRAALTENRVDVDSFGREELNISGDPVPSTDPYGLDRELTRALETYLQPSTTQPHGDALVARARRPRGRGGLRGPARQPPAERGRRPCRDRQLPAAACHPWMRRRPRPRARCRS